MTATKSNAIQQSAVTTAKHKRKALLTSTAMAAAGLMALTTQAHADNWTDHDILTGSTTVDTSVANTTNILQSTDFVKARGSGDIHNGWTVNVAQPSTSAKYVLYDVKGDATQLLGTLNANGEIYIFNQQGVIFGADSVINVGAIVASTGSISDEDIMNGDGKLVFQNADTGASITLNGSVTVAEAGLAAFVAPTVINNGVISAKLGKVALASGNKVTLDLYGDNLVEIAVDDKVANGLIENNGVIDAEAGTVYMAAQTAKEAVDTVINMRGVVSASSASVQGGKIVLAGGKQGKVVVAGTVKADGATGGGVIDVRGQDIEVTESALMSADATQNGNGGNNIVYADNVAIINGRMSARGGALSGNGGFIETSGYELGVSELASVDASAANGLGGLWLLDPLSIVITNSGSGSTVSLSGDVYTRVVANTLSSSLSGGTNVTVQTGVSSSVTGGSNQHNQGDIRVRDSITKTGNSTATLRLVAHDDIFVENGADLTQGSGNGKLNVTLEAGDDITLDDSSKIETKGGNVLFSALGDIYVDDDIYTKGGTASFTAGDRFSLNDGDDLISTIGSDAPITILASEFNLGGYLFAGANTITIGRSTVGTIDVGDSNGSAFLISQSELNKIFAGNLVIGNANTTNVTVDDVEMFSQFNQQDDQLPTPSQGCENSGGGNPNCAQFFEMRDTSLTLKSTNFVDIIGEGLTMGTGTVTVDAPRLDLNARIYAKNTLAGTPFLLGDSRLIGTAPLATINILSPLALINQGINFADDPAALTTINVAAGTYNESVLANEANIKIQGAGQGITIIDPNSPGVHITANDVEVTGLTISTGDSGVFVDNADNANINNVTFNGQTVNAVLVANGSDNATVGNNTITGTGLSVGVNIQGGSNHDVQGNNILGGTLVGVNLFGTTNTDVVNNDILNTASHGLLATSNIGGTINNNTFQNNGGDAIRVSLQTGLTASGNEILGSTTGNGINVGNSSNINLTGNTITGTGSDAISVSGLTGTNTIVNNDLFGSNDETGIKALNSVNLTIAQNVIDDYETGVDIDGGSNVMVGGNLPADGNTMTSVENGVLADSVSGLVVKNNTMTGNSILGVHVLNSNGAAVVGNILNEFATGVKVENSDNVNVALNTVTHTTGGTTGILVMGGSDNGDVLSNTVTRYNIGIDGQNGNNIEIANNTVNNSTQHGIRLLNATNSLIGSGVLAGGNIVNGTANGFQQNGIQVTNGTDNRVFFNTVNNAGWDGISVWNSPNVQVNDNRVNGSYRSAIALGASNNAQILRNILNGNWGGMWLSSSNGVDVRDNQINTTTGWHGIYVDGAMDDLDIQTNTVDNANQSGIYVQNASNVRIGGTIAGNGNTVTGAGVDGIYAAGLTGTNRIGYNTVTMSDSGDHDGIDVDNSGAMTINNNVVSGAGDNGIELSGNTALTTIIGNNVSFSGWDGINVQFGNAFVDVTGNTVLDTLGASGIAFINHGGDGRIHNNVVRRSGRLGVYVGNASGLEITNNTISNSGQEFATNGSRWAGIHAEWANNTLIENNTVSASSGDGINLGGPINGGLVGTTGNIIRNNVVYGTGLDGISVDSSAGVQVRDNKIGVNSGLVVQGADNIGAEGIDVNNSAGAQITGNYIRETASNGISINPSPNSLISGNNVAAFVGNGIYVLSSDNTDVLGNTVDNDGTGTGIRVENSNGVEVGNDGLANRNTITDVATGIAVVGGANVDIDNNRIINANVGIDALNTGGTLWVLDNEIDADGGHNNGTVGVRVVNGATIVIGGGEGAWNAGTSDGNLIDDFTTGISVDGATTLTVDNNDVTDGDYGIDVNGVSGTTTIVDNLVDATNGRIGGVTGIEVTNSGTTLIGGAGNGNVIDGFGTGVNLFNDLGTTVTENDITDVTTGIRADQMGTSLWIDNNDIDAHNSDVAGSGYVGIYVTNSNNVQVGEGTPGNGNDVDDFQYGIAVVGGNNVTIDANEVTDGNYGIYADTVGGLRIFDNLADGRDGKPGNGSAYGIYVNNSFDAQIGALNDGNTVEDYVVGIRVNGSNSADVKYNDVDETTGNGIEIAFSNDVVVDRNDVDDSGWDNINVFGSNNADITNNALSDATGASGIAVINSEDAYVYNNDIWNSARLGIYVGNGDRIVIDNNRIDDVGLEVGLSWSGIHVEATDSATITNNDIDGADRDGINLGDSINWSGGTETNTGTLIVNGNLVRNVSRDGIHGTANVDQVNNNVIYRTGNDGIWLDNSDFVDVKNNKIGTNSANVTQGNNNIGGDGIQVNNSDNAEITGNRIREARFNGIFVDPSDDVEIAWNDIAFSGTNGIYLLDGNRGYIHNNNVDESGQDGIKVDNNDDVRVHNNDVDDSGDSGIEVWNSYNADIVGNEISDSDGDGIELGNSDWADVRNNDIEDSGDDGIDVENSDDVDVNDNNVDNSDYNGIEVTNSDDAEVGGNTVTRAGVDGINMENGNDGWIHDNVIRGTDGGFFVSGVVGAGRDGIHVDDNDGVLVEDNLIQGGNGGFFSTGGAGAGRDGIHVVNSFDADVLDNTVAGGNGWIFGAGGAGAGQDGIFANNNLFSDVRWNDVSDTGDDGIDVRNSVGVDIVGNDTDDTDGDGIQLRNSAFADIRFNEVDDAGDDGIDVENSAFVDVNSNEVHDTDENGIEVTDSFDADIRNNHVGRTGDDGIFASNIAFGDIRNNYVHNTWDDGIDVRNSFGVDVVSNETEGTFGDGIQVWGNLFADVLNNRVRFAGDDGIDIENNFGTEVSGNDVDFVARNGIEVSDSALITVDANDIGTGFAGFVGGNGIDVRNVFGIDITNNTIGTFVQDNGIYVNPSNQVLIQGNNIDGVGQNGILLNGNDQVRVISNVISNSGARGLFASGSDNVYVFLEDNTFTNNPIGAEFESGEIDLTGLANTFNGGDIALRFAPAPGKLGFAPMSLTGDTIGETIFNGQTTYYVELANGAFFAPGTPTLLDGMNATYDGFRPSTVGGFLTQAQYDAIEAKIYHFNDLSSLGLFFFGLTSSGIDQEDIFRNIAGFNPRNGNLNLTITGLPTVPGFAGSAASFLNSIAPAAGGNAQGGQSPQRFSSLVEQLANIAPAAGGDDTAGAAPATEGAPVVGRSTCWGDAMVAAGAGGIVNMSYDLSPDTALSDAAACQSGI